MSEISQDNFARFFQAPTESEKKEFLDRLLSEISLLRERLLSMEAAQSELEDKLNTARNRERRIRSIVASIEDLIFILNRSGVFVDFFQHTNHPELMVPPEYFLNRSIQEIMPPHIVDPLINTIDTVLTSGETRQIDYNILIEEKERWYSAKISPWRSGADQYGGVVVVVRNITGRIEIQNALSERKARCQVLALQLTEIQENERKELARELHDRVGQNLTALDINLNIIRTQISGNPDQKVRQRLDDSLTLLGETSDQVRDVTSELRTPLLDDYGLLPAVEWYIDRFTCRTGISIKLVDENCDMRHAPHIENTLFRIIQEALNNVARHAQAAHASVTVEMDGRTLRLIVKDDGIGFDVDKVTAPGSGYGWGLLTMNERAEMINGRCTYESTPGAGTTVMVEVNL